MFNQRFFIELLYNKYVTGFILKLGGQTVKILDKGSVELIGPYGLEKGFTSLSKNIARLDTGLITSYALYILVGFVFYVIILFLSLVDNSIIILGLLALHVLIKNSGSSVIHNLGLSRQNKLLSYPNSASYIRKYNFSHSPVNYIQTRNFTCSSRCLMDQDDNNNSSGIIPGQGPEEKLKACIEKYAPTLDDLKTEEFKAQTSGYNAEKPAALFDDINKFANAPVKKTGSRSPRIWSKRAQEVFEEAEAVHRELLPLREVVNQLHCEGRP